MYLLVSYTFDPLYAIHYTQQYGSMSPQKTSQQVAYILHKVCV